VTSGSQGVNAAVITRVLKRRTRPRLTVLLPQSHDRPARRIPRQLGAGCSNLVEKPEPRRPAPADGQQPLQPGDHRRSEQPDLLRPSTTAKPCSHSCRTAEELARWVSLLFFELIQPPIRGSGAAAPPVGCATGAARQPQIAPQARLPRCLKQFRPASSGPASAPGPCRDG